MRVKLIATPSSRKALLKDFFKLAVQDFETVCNHKDCTLADVWTAHLGRTQNKEEAQCNQQQSKQANSLPCRKSTFKQRRTQSQIIVPLSMRNSVCSAKSTLTASNTRADVSIFIWQQFPDGKFHKKFLSDMEAYELFERLARDRAKRTAKSQIQ